MVSQQNELNTIKKTWNKSIEYVLYIKVVLEEELL